jgi:DnaJ-class molecular chaperone
MHKEVCPICDGTRVEHKMLGSETVRCQTCWGTGFIETENIFTFVREYEARSKNGNLVWSFVRINDPTLYIVEFEEN